ncbi:MAG: dihydrofolate reductase [Patescibacteria group bacterium]
MKKIVFWTTVNRNRIPVMQYHSGFNQLKLTHEFKRTVGDCPVVLNDIFYENIAIKNTHPFTCRDIIVFSENGFIAPPSLTRVHAARSIDQLFQKINTVGTCETAFVLGNEDLFQVLLASYKQYISEIHIMELQSEDEAGGNCFPFLDPEYWNKETKDMLTADRQNTYDAKYFIYTPA